MNFGKIKNIDIANGIGCRVSIYVSGCPHHCKGCFNSELWDMTVGKPFTDNTLNELLLLANKEYIHGLSILGGEPLAPYNIKQVTLLCKQFKEAFPNKTIWLWSGYLWESYIKDLNILPYIDVIIDGPFIEDKKDWKLFFRGSSNQRIIDVKKTLRNNQLTLVDFQTAES